MVPSFLTHAIYSLSPPPFSSSLPPSLYLPFPSLPPPPFLFLHFIKYIP